MQNEYLLKGRLFLLIFLLMPTLSFGMDRTDKVENNDENSELVQTTNKSIKNFDEMEDFLGVLLWDVAEKTAPFLTKESFVALSLLSKNHYKKFKSKGMQELKNNEMKRNQQKNFLNFFDPDNIYNVLRDTVISMANLGSMQLLLNDRYEKQFRIDTIQQIRDGENLSATFIPVIEVTQYSPGNKYLFILLDIDEELLPEATVDQVIGTAKTSYPNISSYICAISPRYGNKINNQNNVEIFLKRIPGDFAENVFCLWIANKKLGIKDLNIRCIPEHLTKLSNIISLHVKYGCLKTFPDLSSFKFLRDINCENNGFEKFPTRSLLPEKLIDTLRLRLKGAPEGIIFPDDMKPSEWRGISYDIKTPDVSPSSSQNQPKQNQEEKQSVRRILFN